MKWRRSSWTSSQTDPVKATGTAPPNRVVPALCLAAVAAWLGLASVSVAPNRIVPGEPYSAVELLGWPGAVAACLPFAILVALAWRPSTRRWQAALVVTALLLAALPGWLALAGALAIDPDMPSARVGVGPATWTLLFCLALLLIELRMRLAMSGWLNGLVLVPVVVAWLGTMPWLSSLALWQEFAGRSGAFTEALLQHLLLVGSAIVASLVLGAAIAGAMRRHAGLERGGFAVLNVLQTIPSLALFGLLLAPLAWLGARFDWLGDLGVSGIGWAPAFLALLGYSLLPMVRNTFVALSEVDSAVLDAARGMGMGPGQVFWQVRVPLALPVMLEGVRITTVQAIGLTAVAALIGAGGLGTFIFQGLGQAAMDLVLLGALPIVAMALVADALLGALSRRLHYRHRIAREAQL